MDYARKSNIMTQYEHVKQGDDEQTMLYKSRFLSLRRQYMDTCGMDDVKAEPLSVLKFFNSLSDKQHGNFKNDQISLMQRKPVAMYKLESVDQITEDALIIDTSNQRSCL